MSVVPAVDLLRALCTITTDFIAVIDSEGRYQDILPTQVPGLDVTSGIGATMRAALPAPLADRFLAVIQQVLTTRTTETFTYDFKVDTDTNWFAATVTPLTDTLVLWLARDVTEQVALERAQARLQLFEAVAEQALDGISVANPDGEMIYANPAFRTTSGYNDQLIGMNFINLYPPDQQARVEAEATPAMQCDGHWQGNLRAQRPDGSFWDAQLSSFLIHDPLQETPLFGAIFRDVTEQQVQAERLRQFQLLVETVPDGIVIVGEGRKVSYANPAFQTLTGYGTAAIGMLITDFFDPAIYEQMETEIVPHLARTGTWQGTITYRHADGTIFPVQLSSVLLTGAHRTSTSVAVVRDLTAQRQAEEERFALQQTIIETQQIVLRELSTPLVPVADEIVVMPLVGALDSQRTQQVMETLLEGIVAQQATYAILDITGVKVVDTQVAAALMRVAQAAKLLGTQVILTGIGAEVAQALVHLGADLSGIVTRSNLQVGITYALAQRDT